MPLPADFPQVPVPPATIIPVGQPPLDANGNVTKPWFDAVNGLLRWARELREYDKAVRARLDTL